MTKETFEKARDILYQIKDIEDAIERTVKSNAGVYIDGFTVTENDLLEIKQLVRKELITRFGSRLHKLNAEFDDL